MDSSVKADWCIYKPFQNHQFERENKNITSLLETFYKLFYWSKKNNQ